MKDYIIQNEGMNQGLRENREFIENKIDKGNDINQENRPLMI